MSRDKIDMLDALVPLLQALDALVSCEHPSIARQSSAVGAQRCCLCGAQREGGGGPWEFPERLAAVARLHADLQQPGKHGG